MKDYSELFKISAKIGGPIILVLSSVMLLQLKSDFKQLSKEGAPAESMRVNVLLLCVVLSLFIYSLFLCYYGWIKKNK